MIRRLLIQVIVLSAVMAPAAGRGLAGDGAALDERQEPSLEGLYFDWSLYELQENGNPVCYLASNLERSTDAVPRRRPAFVLITNRPAEGKRGVVSVTPGYTYEEGATVLLTVGRKQFHLFTDRGAAWAADQDDARIIQAIRGGSTLVVSGRVKDGPATTDVFSLRGAGPALAALDRACPVVGAPEATVHRKKRRRAR